MLSFRSLHTVLTIACRISEEKYLDGFRPTLMEVVYLWSKGMSFQSICDATDVFEGSVVRALRRLFELLDSLDQASTVVGDTDLSERFKRSKESIRKGLPFAASLYV
jgi:ATP-dependent RNA helicase DOB1